MVFALACGAALTTLNAKKITLASPDCWLSEDFNGLFATNKCQSNAITATAGAEASNCFLSATMGSLLSRLRCLGTPFGSLSAWIDGPDVPSSSLMHTRRCLDAPGAVWRRQFSAQTFKKLLKSLQKRFRERLGERTEPQDAPGEAYTTKNIKNTMV